MADLKLKTGGLLIKSEWRRPERPRFYPVPVEVLEDVSDEAALYLMESVDLDTDVTLLDLFKLLCNNELLQACFARQQVKDCFQASFTLERPPFMGQHRSDDLEYLELYYEWSKDRKTNSFGSVHRLNLRGIGPVLSEDLIEYGALLGRKGGRATYAPSSRPVEQLLGLPLRYKPEVNVRESCPDDLSTFDATVETALVDSPTLGQVFQSVLAELWVYKPSNESADKWAFLKGLVAESAKEYSDGLNQQPAPDK